jgi:O-antigen/teichoic acid export membrane protein
MLGKRIALYAMGPIGVAALSFIILPLLTWIATPETVAVYSLFTVVLNLTVMASSFGLDQALVRFYYATADKIKLLLKTITPGLLLLCVTAAVVYFSEYDLSANTIGLSGGSLVLCIAIFLAYHSRFYSLVLRMEDKAFHYSFSQLLPKIWFLCALMYFYFS